MSEVNREDEWREWLETVFNTALTEQVAATVDAALEAPIVAARVPDGLDTLPLFDAAFRAVDAQWVEEPDCGWLVDVHDYERLVEHAAKMVTGSADANWDAGNVVDVLRSAWGLPR